MKKVSRTKLARVAVELLDVYTHKQVAEVLASEVVRRRLVPQLDLLLADITTEILRQRGHLAAEVVSAHPLSEAVLSKVNQMLSAQTGAKTIELTQKQDPSLLGGLLIQTPELAVDLSVRNRLERLKV